MDELFFHDETPVDDLTKLYTREVVEEYIAYLIKEKSSFSIALVDIDNFKYVNDNYGHDDGDKIIFAVSRRIKNVVGKNGVVARFGGDEFLIVLKDNVQYESIWKICHAMNIADTAIAGYNNLNVTFTIGVSRFPENGTSWEKLLENAEKALYRGKMKGRNCFIIYLPEKHANIVLKNDKEKEKSLTSMYLHSTVFRLLSNSEDLKTGIEGLFNFISSYYVVDHICIQSQGKLLFQKIHQLASQNKFSYVNDQLIKEYMNTSIETFYMNDVKQLVRANQMDLYNILTKQHITSTCFCEISYHGKSYGMLRADVTGLSDSTRIWQYSDMDILITTAKTIAMILYYTGKTLETV